MFFAPLMNYLQNKKIKKGKVQFLVQFDRQSNAKMVVIHIFVIMIQ